MATETKNEQKEQVQTVTLTIDGRQVTVPRGTSVLQASLDMGIHVPSFCWHPKLKSVGSCRMCYVEIEKMPKLAVSCSTECMDGMVVQTQSDKVRQGRKAVLEFTLLNHPLDCPTCDKGGECELQNLTFRHGYDDSRNDFTKVRHTVEGVDSTFDDVRIGPEIILNRNRCILCYKCVRSNKEAFGEYDLGAYERGNHTEINAAPGCQVTNPFSGNLVEICPVGALTNTDWRYKIRVWLTKQAASICPYTSSGTNITFYKEDHKQKIFRVTSRRNDAIDDGWLADVTRYGYQSVMSDDRLKTPLIKKDGKQVTATWDEALDLAAKRLKEIDDTKGNVCIGGLIGSHLDIATMHSFNTLMRKVIGTPNIDHRTSYRMLPVSGATPSTILASRPFSIADIDDSDVIVTFATDLLREHPNEYLRIRKASNFRHARIVSITPYAVKNADVASLEVVYKPGADEQVINAICLAALENGLVDSGRAASLKGKLTPGTAAEAGKLAGVDPDEINAIAAMLANGKKITFIVGEGCALSMQRDLISAAIANLNKLFDLDTRGQVALLARQANSKGAEKLGLLPYPAPEVKATLEKIWGTFPDKEAPTTDRMLVQMKKEAINACVIVGANPIMLYPDRDFAREGLERLDFLVACDLFETDTTEIADVVLPLASWAEFAGGYVNLEGRHQLTEAAIKPRFESKPGYEILAELARRMGSELFESPAQRDEQIAQVLAVDHVLPWPTDYLEVAPASDDVSGDFAVPLFFVDDAHHSGHLTEKSNSLVNFVGDAYIEISPELAGKLDVTEGASVRVESEAGKVMLPVRISSVLDTDCAIVPRNFASCAVNALLMRKHRVDMVKISKVAG